jgi:hypothetical protein
MSAGCPVGKRGGLGRAGKERNCVRLSEGRDKASALFRQVKNGIDPLTARDAALAAAKAAAQDAAIKASPSAIHPKVGQPRLQARPLSPLSSAEGVVARRNDEATEHLT